MNNLPNKHVREPIGKCCSPAEGVLHIYNNEGYRIVEIIYNPKHPDYLAESIARAIIEARDIGYLVINNVKKIY